MELLYDLSWRDGIITPGLTKFLLIMPYFAKAEFYFISIFFGWLIFVKDRKFWLNLGLFTTLSAFTNRILKELFKQPRPDIDYLIDMGTSYSFPSGDVQVVTLFWLMLYFNYRKKFLLVLALIIISLVAFSRMYFGVHYPIDVIFGFIIGCIFVLIYKYKLISIHTYGDNSFKFLTQIITITIIYLYMIWNHFHTIDKYTLIGLAFVMLLASITKYFPLKKT